MALVGLWQGPGNIDLYLTAPVDLAAHLQRFTQAEAALLAFIREEKAFFVKTIQVANRVCLATNI
jgi:hypothetical protein